MRVFKDMEIAKNRIRGLSNIIVKANTLSVDTVGLLQKNSKKIIEETLEDFSVLRDIVSELMTETIGANVSREKNGKYTIKIDLTNDELKNEIVNKLGSGAGVRFRLALTLNGDTGKIEKCNLVINITTLLEFNVKEVGGAKLRLCSIKHTLNNEKDNGLYLLTKCMTKVQENINTYNGAIEIHMDGESITFGKNEYALPSLNELINNQHHTMNIGGEETNVIVVSPNHHANLHGYKL